MIMAREEQYVNYKTAKLLKEKGFAWRVFDFYDEHGVFSEHIGSVYSLYNWNYQTKDEYCSQYCSAPTQQMTCDWVEKAYGFFIEISRSIDLNGNYHYFYMILDKTCKYVSSASKDNNYSSKFDAVNAALEYVLTKLI